MRIFAGPYLIYPPLSTLAWREIDPYPIVPYFSSHCKKICSTNSAQITEMVGCFFKALPAAYSPKNGKILPKLQPDRPLFQARFRCFCAVQSEILLRPIGWAENGQLTCILYPPNRAENTHSVYVKQKMGRFSLPRLEEKPRLILAKSIPINGCKILPKFHLKILPKF